MTVCVAALCENGKALVMAADKMVGMTYVEGEPDITKMRPLHKDWWVLFAGDHVAPAFDIIDYAKAELHKLHKLSADQPASLEAVKRSMQKGFEKKRLEEAEALYLKTIGWTLDRFNRDGYQVLPNSSQIQSDIDRYRLHVQLLIAGFEDGDGLLFEIAGYGDKPGIPVRFDIPGFHAIGSGSTVAIFMMYYRGLSPRTSGRDAAYYSLEAKYYGEQASGVGLDSDLFLAKPGEDLITIGDERIEECLIPICKALSPREIRKADRKRLNEMAELKWFGPSTEPPKKTKAGKAKNPAPDAND